MQSLLSALLYAHLTAAVALDRNDQAPNFNLPILSGIGRINLEQYQGKVLYLDFWASSCYACRLSFPILNKLRASYASQGFEILAVNVDPNPEDAKAFLQEYPLDYPTIRDKDGKLAQQYDVQVLPTGFLLDAKGKVRLIHFGMSAKHQDFLSALIEKLLAEQIQ